MHSRRPGRPINISPKKMGKIVRKSYDQASALYIEAEADAEVTVKHSDLPQAEKEAFLKATKEAAGRYTEVAARKKIVRRLAQVITGKVLTQYGIRDSTVRSQIQIAVQKVANSQVEDRKTKVADFHNLYSLVESTLKNRIQTINFINQIFRQLGKDSNRTKLLETV